ncbi:MAG: hypothetical protein BGO49_01690 [Planctomycetales bacterium 71-10]|nr:MAG: hypothetical protein BGO49_01690 [Planctomycetales bacterium 71-10]
MTMPRALRPIVRLTPLLAWLVVCASAAPSATAAGCSHPAPVAGTFRASASLQILEIADAGGTNWTLPGAPCNGPRCRSKAPAADVPAVPVAMPDRHEAVAAAMAFSTPPSSIAAVRVEPLLCPIRALTALERPPRSV